MKKKLVTETDEGLASKDILIFNEPSEMKAILHDIRWTILQKISKEPKFAAELARELNLHEQKIYYHLRQLSKANLIKVAYEEEIRGAIARFYTINESSFGIELNPADKGFISQSVSQVDEKLHLFFKEFQREGSFDGLVVVGAPDAHGPHKTWARDGHYAIYLAMFMGQILKSTEELYVKLDVEVRAEKALDQNLILIGGPAVNLVTQDINAKMKKPAFDNHIQGIAPDARFGRGITSRDPKIFYSQNNVGIIFKAKNPYNPEKTVIAFAGQGRRGTKAAILALTNNWEKILKDYSGGSYRLVVEGFDLNGDGTVDSVEILE
ncbi:MAG: S-layer protein [Asgard group archaeon]|nr:S-layer protein [Asgard group archaeon]